MRRPGREFGEEKPGVIYVALRWNGAHPTTAEEDTMRKFVKEHLRGGQKALRMYNLVRPSKSRGMGLSLREFGEVEQTVRRIQQKIQRQPSLRHIVVGGATGPMPYVALLLKPLLPRVRIELVYHHKARNGRPLSPVPGFRN